MVFVASLFLGVNAYAAPPDIYGIWFTQDKAAKVEINDCGDGTPCGTLIWFESEPGEVVLDTQNPDPDLQVRPLLGSSVFWGYKPGKNKWKSGKIYDAGSGKTYKSKISLENDGTLKVKGCIGPICQGQTWVRADN